MSTRWIRSNMQQFARDVMRDFCLACDLLERQFAHFSASGSVTFSVFSELQGTVMNKGLLWRLKDTAHHLFGNDADPRGIAPLIDWTMGYVFHECIKLKEDAYQHERYALRYCLMKRSSQGKEAETMVASMGGILSQTQESMSREVERIRFLLEQIKVMFCLYYETQADNRLLARLLHDREELVRTVFGSHYEALLRAIYKNSPEHLYMQAGTSLMEGGRYAEAVRATAMATELAPHCDNARQLHKQAARLHHDTSQRRTTRP